MRADRQTDTLITILRTVPGATMTLSTTSHTHARSRGYDDAVHNFTHARTDRFVRSVNGP